MESVKCAMIVLFIFLFAMPLSVFAQLYQYTNADGVMCFTDDLSKFPVGQRDQLIIINEIKTESADIPQIEPSPPSSEDKVNRLSDVLLQERDALKQANEQLKADHALFIDENKQLANLRQALEGRKNISRSELDDFNKRVSDMNIKTQQYDARLKAHEESVRVYNLKIERIKKVAGSATEEE